MKHSIKFLVVFSFVLIFNSISAQSQDKINWMTWDEMMKKQQVEKKKILVDLYTDWCGWCKKMDKTTFLNPVIVKSINEMYYPVKFNAEQKEDITFQGKTYKFIGQGRRGYHELAAALTQNQLSFPTYVFLDDKFSLLQVIPGYQNAKTFEYILHFFGKEHYKDTPWAKFEKEFKSRL